MRFELSRIIGEFRKIVAIREIIAKEDMHDGAGKCSVGSGFEAQSEISLLHCGGLIDIDGDNFCPAFFAGADCVGHDVDLGRHGVCAPNNNAIGFRNFARIGAHQTACSSHVAGPGEVNANGGEKAGIFLGVAETVDPVPHDEAHCAGVVIGPNGLSTVRCFNFKKALGDEVHRLVPAGAPEFARALFASANQWIEKAIGVVVALGIARDFRADDAIRVGLFRRAIDAADPLSVDDLDFKRAG